MISTDVTDLRRLIGEIRKTFRLMAGMSDRMLEARGLTASLRAILEFLTDEGPCPVPKMAAAKSMTRQSVQALVDRLEALGLVETWPNPDHKRSVLIALTAEGQSMFQAVLAEEKDLLIQISRDWTEGDLQETCRTLQVFQARLSELRSEIDASYPETDA